MNKKNKKTLKKIEILTTFLCILFSAIITFFIVWLLQLCGINFSSISIYVFTLLVLGFGILLGTFLAYTVSKFKTNRQRRIDNIITQVISGNFNVEIPTKFGFSFVNVKDINTMIKELNNVQMLKSDFISNFSHEFKTPIVSIKGYSEILLNEDLPKDKQKEFLQIIYDECNRLSKLSSNMLLLSNLESSSIVPKKSLFYLNEQINSCVHLLSNGIKDKNIKINLNLEQIQIFGNMDMMSQIWLNLISNAIKFTNNDGHIDIKLFKENNNAVVKIEDDGIGIENENLSHIFDKFYKADKSHATNGNGLGLAITKQIIILHNGTITVESIKNQGSKFIIYLPLNWL